MDELLLVGRKRAFCVFENRTQKGVFLCGKLEQQKGVCVLFKCGTQIGVCFEKRITGCVSLEMETRAEFYKMYIDVHCQCSAMD